MPYITYKEESLGKYLVRKQKNDLWYKVIIIDTNGSNTWNKEAKRESTLNAFIAKKIG